MRFIENEHQYAEAATPQLASAPDEQLLQDASYVPVDYRIPYHKDLNFPFNLLYLKHACLEINATCCRFVIFQSTGKQIKVHKWKEINFADPWYQDVQVLSDALNELASELKRINKLFVNFFYPGTFWEIIDLPPLENERDETNAVDLYWESEFGPESQDGMTTVKVPLGEADIDGVFKKRLLVGAVPSRIIDTIKETLHALDLYPYRLAPHFITFYEISRSISLKTGVEAFLDVNNLFSQLCILNNGRLTDIRTIPIGMAHLSGQKQITPDGDFSQTDMYADKEQVSGSKFASKLSRLLAERKLSENRIFFRFYVEIWRTIEDGAIERIDSLQVSGNGAKMPVFADFLEQKLNIPVYKTIPNLQGDEDDVDPETVQYFTTAQSALATQEINMISRDLRYLRLFKSLSFFASLMLLIMTVVAIGLSVVQNDLYESMAPTIASVEEFHDALDDTENHYNNLIRDISLARKENKQIRTTIPESVPVTDILRFLSNEVPDVIELDQIEIGNVEDLKIDAKKHGGYYAFTMQASISDDGVNSETSLVEFVNHLQELAVFKDVILVEKNKSKGRTQLQFRIMVIL